MAPRPEFDPEIDRYYSRDWDEDGRLRSGIGELEYLRTQEIVRRFVPPGERLRILDVGGGSGVHAEWLLADGHEVVLVDPVTLHVTQATTAIDSERFAAIQGDARSLDFADEAFDAVLLLGPLYHLTEASERALAWSEAARVVRGSGTVIAAGITKFASLFSGLDSNEIFVDEFRAIVGQDLIDGQHRNHPGRDYFTTAFFHHPQLFVEEAITAGLEDVELFAVEGPVGAVPDLEGAFRDPQRREVLLEFVRRVESEPSLMGIGPHVLAVCRRPAA